jgi:hypothetical protein
MKLLQLALEKQDYNLAAHILVYGLIKASQRTSRNPANPGQPRNHHGNKNSKKQRQR